MNIVQIRTIGEVALPSTMNSSVGYLYDIPTDDLGIPYLPANAILGACSAPLPDIKMGFAHPDGYMGLMHSANLLKENIARCVPLIRSYFVNERLLPEKMLNVRCLKPGQVLKAHISFEEKDRKAIQKALAAITHIGVSDGTITGEVSVELLSMARRDENAHALPGKYSCSSLDISCFLRAPACFHTPFADSIATATYIPGAVIRAELMQKLKKEPIDWERLVFSNAYISMDGQRLLPAPVCLSAVKLDKEQLRYRLADGKDPAIVEQDKNLEESYTNECCSRLIHYAVPETEHILSRDGTLYDALCPGQIFQGTIYGPDADLRRIAAHIFRYPITNMGTLSEEGFGEVLYMIGRAGGKEIREECLHRSFDVCCVSNTLILNGRGLPSCRAEDLLAEIEYTLGVSGRLRIVGKYTGVFHDFSRNPRWQEDRGVVRCFAKGSILRLEVIGEPIDIFPIRHCFIGERTQEGYGEICTWPARGEYYRLGEQLRLPRYNVPFRESPRNMILGARMTKAVITAILKSKVQALAATDQGEYAAGYSLETLVPTSILDMFRDQYDPLLSGEEIARWYSEMLKGGRDHGRDS